MIVAPRRRDGWVGVAVLAPWRNTKPSGKSKHLQGAAFHLHDEQTARDLGRRVISLSFH